MEKAKRILFTIAGILSIVCVVAYLITGSVFLAVANNVDFVEKMADESTGSMDAEAVKAIFMMFGVIFIICGLLSIVNIILSFKGKNSDSKGIMIANIVIGALSGVEINILAAIFGLIARNQKKKPSQIEE